MVRFFYSVRSRLVVSMIGIALLIGASSLFIGREVLYNAILNEARARVLANLIELENILERDLHEMRLVFGLISKDKSLISAIKSRERTKAMPFMYTIRSMLPVDFVGIVTPDGDILVNTSGGRAEGKTSLRDAFFLDTIKNGAPVFGATVISKEFLMREDPGLLEKSRIRVPSHEGEDVTSALALVGAMPIFNEARLIGVLYGGIILNKNYELLDRVRNTIFHPEEKSHISTGTVTVFLDDIRISTNVETSSGEKAVGTKVSPEVRKHVLEEGKTWLGRAYVVNDWYISAYKPIKDIWGKTVGMLYVGIQEKRYTEIWRKANIVLVPITTISLIFGVFLGYYITNGILKPLRALIESAREVQRGNFSIKVGNKPKNEIGILQQVFEEMVESLKERERIKGMEKEILYLKSEKQASLGKLAAGVAHEINNPLTGVLTYTHMLLKREDLPEDVRSDLQVVAEATERVRKIVRGLLSFSREMPLQREPTDINELVRSTLALVENQALIKGVHLIFEESLEVPKIFLDKNQMQSVILNLIINALDATPKGGTIKVTTDLVASTDSSGELKRQVEISVMDTGCGIPAENIERIFDPFFTTKEVGQGTGLGLAVAKGVTERHGGTIRVKSEVGKGSIFTVELPVKETDD